MTEVKWIKVVTDIFEDEKVLLIESLPSADSIMVIWFKLLCLAGKTNNSGVFIFNDRIPYTVEMLSSIFRRDINTVRLALTTFEEFGMIEIINNVITLPNWDKHQSLDAYEKRKEQDRNRKKLMREQQKALISSKSVDASVDMSADVRTLDKDIDIEEDIDKEIDITSSCSYSAQAREKSPEEEAVSQVMNYYLDKINASPSSTSCEELLCYIPILSHDVVIKAMSIAVDENKRQWSYIRAILQNWAKLDVKTLDDVQRIQNDRDAAKAESQAQRNNKANADKPSKYTTAANYKTPTGRDDSALMRQLLDKQRQTNQGEGLKSG